MGQLDNHLAENPDTGDTKLTENLLSAMTRELENLKLNLIGQLNQDVERLQADKTRLRQEIDKLEQDRYQQLTQQQQMAKQLAQGLANQLQEQLMQQLHETALRSRSPLNNANSSATAPSSDYNENIYRLLGSLDSTLRTTFKTLQQDLNSYQSSLSQQLSHMHSMEQQGEAILEALVDRISEQLQAGSQRTSRDGQSPTLSDRDRNLTASNSTGLQQPLNASTPPAPEPLLTPTKLEARKEGLSQVQIGFILVLLSTVALSVHNVIVGIVGFPSKILGVYPMGGFIDIRALGNSLLLLWIRMMVVVPLLALVAKSLYPPMWTDLKRVLTSPQRGPLFSAIAAGGSLFLSQVLIYIAIGEIGPGVAVTILFMYPIVTVPVAWLLFRDRPSSLRIGVMFAVAIGVFLAAWPKIFPAANAAAKTVSVQGVGIAVASGIAFAFYLIFIQIAFQKRIAPVPVSLIQFATIFVLCSLSLMLPIPLGVKVEAAKQQGLLIGGIVLGVLTLLGYLLNNFAIRNMGAARAAIVSSMGPALTAILALLVVPAPQNFLQTIQIAGILLVTLAVGTLSFEKLQGQPQPPKPAR